MTILVEIEYEINPENYPEGKSFKEMLALDVEHAIDDPFLTMESGDKQKWTITGELLGEKWKNNEFPMDTKCTEGVI
jgi:hypothetical protein